MINSKIFYKVEFYIISLWMLFILLIIINTNIPTCFHGDCIFIGLSKVIYMNFIPFLSFVFLLLGMFSFLRFNYRISGSKSLAVFIEDIEDVNYEQLTFLATYIIPLVLFNLANERYIISLVFLLCVIGIIYVKTDKFYVNPTLAVLGYRLYKANIKTRTTVREGVVIITKDRLSQADEIRILSLDEKVYFARRIK